MSLYADYVTERTHFEIIEKDYGFITYSIEQNICYIQDLYILPDLRQTKLASSLANEVMEIAKTKSCKHLMGTVSPKSKEPETSIKVLLAYGMKLHSSNDQLIIFTKEII